MKNNILAKVTYFLLFLTLILSSCKNYIEIQPRGSVDLEYFFQTKADCDNFINPIYRRSMMGYGWWEVASPRSAIEMSTDDGWMGNTQQGSGDYYPSAFFTYSAQDVGHVYHYWREKYKVILNCNEGIAKAPGIKSISQNDLNQFLGECYFFRAINYFHLVNVHGFVPLTTGYLATDQLNLKNNDPNQPKLVYDQIVSDLNKAKELLSFNKTKGTRINYYVPEAYLARVYLFMGKFQESYTAADNVVKSGLYSLTPDFIDITSYKNRNGVESILECQTLANILPEKSGNIISMVCGARAEKADSMVINGIKVPSFIKGRAALKDGWARGGAPTSNLEQAFLSENDYIRMGSTITKYGEPVYGDEVEVPHYNILLSQNKSGRGCRKYYLPVACRLTISDIDDAPLPLIDMRLGEVILTRAEAAFKNGNEGQALADVNMIRARVKLPAKAGLSGSGLLRHIWKERRLELAFEGLRYYDLRREIEPDGVNSGKPVICSIMGPNGSFVKYNTEQSKDPFETTNLIEAQNKGSLFQWPKHQYFPVPQREIDNANGTLTQIAGY